MSAMRRMLPGPTRLVGAVVATVVLVVGLTPGLAQAVDRRYYYGDATYGQLHSSPELWPMTGGVVSTGPALQPIIRTRDIGGRTVFQARGTGGRVTMNHSVVYNSFSTCLWTYSSPISGASNIQCWYRSPY